MRVDCVLILTRVIEKLSTVLLIKYQSLDYRIEPHGVCVCVIVALVIAIERNHNTLIETRKNNNTVNDIFLNVFKTRNNI